MSTYRHTQPGYVIIGCMLVTCVVLSIAGPALLSYRLPVATITPAFAGLLLISVLFCTLTVEVGNGRIRWWFGPGLIAKSVHLDEIARVEPWKMRGIGAWGIHWSSQGWLYNVSGRRGVLFVMKSGKQFILGTDEPEILLAAIHKAKGSSPAA